MEKGLSTFLLYCPSLVGNTGNQMGWLGFSERIKLLLKTFKV